MAPEQNNPVVASSNNDNVDDLRSEESPRWESNPEEDNFDDVTVTVTVSDEDSFVNEVSVDRTQNIDNITVTLVDSEGNVVSRISFFHKLINCNVVDILLLFI